MVLLAITDSPVDNVMLVGLFDELTRPSQVSSDVALGWPQDGDADFVATDDLPQSRGAILLLLQCVFLCMWIWVEICLQLKNGQKLPRHRRGFGAARPALPSFARTEKMTLSVTACETARIDNVTRVLHNKTPRRLSAHGEHGLLRCEGELDSAGGNVYICSYVRSFKCKSGR